MIWRVCESRLSFYTEENGVLLHKKRSVMDLLLRLPSRCQIGYEISEDPVQYEYND